MVQEMKSNNEIVRCTMKSNWVWMKSSVCHLRWNQIRLNLAIRQISSQSDFIHKSGFIPQKADLIEKTTGRNLSFFWSGRRDSSQAKRRVSEVQRSATSFRFPLREEKAGAKAKGTKERKWVVHFLSFVTQSRAHAWRNVRDSNAFPAQLKIRGFDIPHK